MLIAMKKNSSNRICVVCATEYSTKHDKFFSHENLEVYQTVLSLTKWAENITGSNSCSSDLLTNPDKSSTGIVPYIAEENGRFSKTDQVRFLRISHKAAIQSASLVDIPAVDGVSDAKSQDGKTLLRQIGAC